MMSEYRITDKEFGMLIAAKSFDEACDSYIALRKASNPSYTPPHGELYDADKLYHTNRYADCILAPSYSSATVF